MNAALQAERVSVHVDGRILVRDVSLDFAAGQMSVVIGPNGAGKTTLMRTLSGETPPNAGEVRSRGAKLFEIPPWRLACRRAVMTQSANFPFPFEVHEIVRLGASGKGRARSRAEENVLVERALAAADALHLAGRNVQTLSGGEQQRVQFARVHCQLEAGRGVEPEQILLLDEPVASLDLHHQLALLDAASGLARSHGMAVVAVLHDLNLAAAYADQLVVVTRGRIHASGAPADVLTADLLRRAFSIEGEPRAIPADDAPFILPQTCKRATRTD